MANNHLDIRPLSPHIGALIDGIDLGQTLDDHTVDEIRNALVNHQVVFFENQDITAEQQLAFAKRFGEIEEPHPVFGQHAHDARLSIIESRGRVGDERNLSTTLRHSPLQFTVQDLLSLDWVG